MPLPRRRRAGHAQVVWVPHRGLKPEDYKAALKQAKRQLRRWGLACCGDRCLLHARLSQLAVKCTRCWHVCPM